MNLYGGNTYVVNASHNAVTIILMEYYYSAIIKLAIGHYKKCA